MDKLEIAVLIGLASWRLANLLVNEDGPFGILEKFRNQMGLREGQISGLFPLMLTCVYCTSVWTTLIMLGIWFLEPYIVVFFAGATIALIANRFTQGE